MTETIPNQKAIKWVIFTLFTPLSVSMLAANVPIALWYYRMAEAGTPFQGPPPASVIQHAVMLTAGVGLWFTVLLWWFLHRKKDSFAKLFGTTTHTITSRQLQDVPLNNRSVLDLALTAPNVTGDAADDCTETRVQDVTRLTR